MVFNAPFGMYPYSQYDFSNPYVTPFAQGPEPQQHQTHEQEADAFIVREKHVEEPPKHKTSLSNLLMSIGLGGCVATIGVILLKHAFRPRDAKFLNAAKKVVNKNTVTKAEKIAKDTAKDTAKETQVSVDNVVNNSVNQSVSAPKTEKVLNDSKINGNNVVDTSSKPSAQKAEPVVTPPASNITNAPKAEKVDPPKKGGAKVEPAKQSNSNQSKFEITKPFTAYEDVIRQHQALQAKHGLINGKLPPAPGSQVKPDVPKAKKGVINWVKNVFKRNNAEKTPETTTVVEPPKVAEFPKPAETEIKLNPENGYNV